MSTRVAIDIGSSTTKLHYGTISDEEITLEEMYRFESRITEEDGRVVWDVDDICSEIIRGLEQVEKEVDEIESIAIDSTAMDFGLIKDGELIRNPYCYRDSSLFSKESEILEEIPRRELYEMTGHYWPPNSLYFQYYENPELFETADHLLMLPQLISFALGAEPAGEETYITSLYAYDPETRDWSSEILERLGIPTDLLPKLSPPGTKIGQFNTSLSTEFENEPDILLPPSHDTAAAVGALPLKSDCKGFLCTGSWFIPGFEIDDPSITDSGYDANAANELGIDGTIRYIQNIPGFSLLEHCRATWEQEGKVYEYDELLSMAQNANLDCPLIDPTDELFFNAQQNGNVIECINGYTADTGQDSPSGEGEITRCILQSLAAQSAIILHTLGISVNQHTDRIHLAGGGVRNTIFCQMVASATGLPVKAGPVEVTAIGNLLSQMIAKGEIESYKQGRKIIEKHIEFTNYEPQKHTEWNKVIFRMRELVE